MKLLHILSFLLSMLVSLSGFSQYASKITWLKENSFPLNGIADTITDNTDLEAFKNAIGDHRVVMLGEQNHGDGSSLLAKSRLVKYLADNMNFEVLIMETPMFGAYQINDLIKTGETDSASKVIKTSVIGFWPGSKQCQGLWTYLKKHPTFDFAGFDPTIISEYARSHLSASAVKVLNKYTPIEEGDQIIMAEVFGNFTDHRKRMVEGWQPSDSLRQAYNHISLKIDSSLGKIQMPNNEIKFWKYWFASANRYLNSVWDGINNRDALMADVLAWYINEYYPNKKVIVWGALRHFLKNPELVNTHIDEVKYDENYTAGNILHKKHNIDFYVLGFTEFAGKTSNGPNPKKYYREAPVAPTSEGSLEYLFKHSGEGEYVFLDLSKPTMPAWMTEMNKSKMIGAVEMDAPWPRIVDGIIYIENMEPNVSPMH